MGRPIDRNKLLGLKRDLTPGAHFPKCGSTSILSPCNAITFSEETRKN